jgi:uncharacterized protein YndB with AHSA1/START domain
MAAATAPAAELSTTLTMTRRFEATPQRVFEAWLDPGQVSLWMGPRGFRADVNQLDARAGGAYAITMHMSDGTSVQVSGIYKEITRHTRLAFTWKWQNDMRDTLVTLTFKPVGNATDLTIEHAGFTSGEQRDNHNKGWTGCLDKLAELLAA